MLKLIVAALALVVMLALPATAQSTSWQTYVNERFGTIADVPADWRAGEPPDNGDGLTFTSPDGQAWVAVFGSLNLFDTVGETMDMLDTPQEGEVITYRHREQRMIVVSGTKGDLIFYEKSILSCRDQIWSGIRLEYPVVRKQSFDAIVTHVARSLRGPGREDLPWASPC